MKAQDRYLPSSEKDDEKGLAAEAVAEVHKKEDQQAAQESLLPIAQIPPLDGGVVTIILIVLVVLVLVAGLYLVYVVRKRRRVGSTSVASTSVPQGERSWREYGSLYGVLWAIVAVVIVVSMGMLLISLTLGPDLLVGLLGNGGLRFVYGVLVGVVLICSGVIAWEWFRRSRRKLGDVDEHDILSSIWIMSNRDEKPLMFYDDVAIRLGRIEDKDTLEKLVLEHRALFRTPVPEWQLKHWKKYREKKYREKNYQKVLNVGSLTKQ